MEFLARSGGRRQGDRIELIPLAEPDAFGAIDQLCLVHGVPYFDRAEEVLQGLRQGDAVEIVPDPTNQVNPLALQVRRQLHPASLYVFTHLVRHKAYIFTHSMRQSAPRVMEERAGRRCGHLRSRVVSQVLLNVDEAELEAIARRYGVVRLEIFGSVARGEEQPDSDIDVLYELPPGARLGWRVDDLAADLAAVFGRPVDLVSRRAIHPLLRKAVLAEALEIYAA
jgi:hypothetical protein